jgi:hypothetical protein
MEKIAKASQTLEKLGWGVSLLLAAVTMEVGIILSVTVNPLFDRSVHPLGLDGCYRPSSLCGPDPGTVVP